MDIDSKLFEWVLVQSYEVKASTKEFWTAIDIYTNRSHIINRRLIGGDILGTIIIYSDQQLQNIINILPTVDCCELVQDLITRENDLSKSSGEKHRVAVIKKVLPKITSLKLNLEVIVNDHAKSHVSFFNIVPQNNCAPCFPYAFSFEEGKLNLWVEQGVKSSDASYQWIVDKVVPKLVKWMESVDDCSSTDKASLRLVPVTEYSILYIKLKETYGKQLVQEKSKVLPLPVSLTSLTKPTEFEITFYLRTVLFIMDKRLKMWPENTDPLKFVYEDIGIATYLLLLWKDKPKQRFVDLGCGNGLLVHILNSEGHLGLGYDLRARKIWALFPPTTKLEVRTIIPSSETVFPNTDWLIGNHSDELTVWVPVMAARSSYSCNFFLLPCCPYEFDGRKYSRIDTSRSQYSDFLTYVEAVCGECGVQAEKDKLRIPSTRRTCFVGRNRTYPESELTSNLQRLQEFVNSKCGVQGSDGGKETLWCPQFKPREEEKVRNCTQVHSDIRESIVSLVTEQLLVKRRTLADGWNYGGIVEISSLARIIPKETLKKLKNECGGLQTLLKNHHFIFKVQSGNVEFRVPTEKVKSDSGVWKKKQCWFFYNHPNSCPLEDEKCSFIHNA